MKVLKKIAMTLAVLSILFVLGSLFTVLGHLALSDMQTPMPAHLKQLMDYAFGVVATWGILMISYMLIRMLIELITSWWKYMKS